MNRKERRRQGNARRRSPGPTAGAPHGLGEAADALAQAGAAFKAGRLPEAEALLRQTVRLDPDHAEAHNWLGIVCQQKGAGREAIAHLERAVALRPDSAEFVNNLGIAELKLNDLEAAARSFEKAVALNPQLAQAPYNLGLVLRKQRRHLRAIACFRRAIVLVPNYGNAHLMLGNALSETGQHDEAIAVFHRLAALAPGVPAPLFNLATALKAAGRLEEAAGVARQILALDPKSVVAHNIMALFLWSISRFDEAEASARHAVSLDPKNAEPYNTLGTILTTLGRLDEAMKCFETAFALEPDFPNAIYQLVTASKASSTPGLAARIEKLLTADWTLDHKTELHFSLGKVYDDLGDYSRAFENFRAGNELAAGKTPFDAAKWHADVDRAIAVFSPAFFAQRRSFGHDQRRPVFIFGMPRSGTTLVEQILASHPEVAPGGELTILPGLIGGLPQRLGTQSGFPDCAPAIDEDRARELAAAYLAGLDKVSATAARVTDKLPFNFENLGLLALLFPQAALIHCRRDALDTCLSCYFTNFAKKIDFTYGLETLGAYYRGYRRLMDHWRQVLPVPMLEVDYEDLVANQDSVSRRLIAHCGLDWDDRCLAFHETERPVGTASTWQVRQPIYKTSVKRWHHYEQFLGPLRAALEGMGS